MRYCGFSILILALLAVVCGCLQSSPAPSPTSMATPSLPTPFPATVPAQKQINVAASVIDQDLIVQYNGGRDAAYLTGLRVQIDNRNGEIRKRVFYAPQIGQTYVFPYSGKPDVNTVNVVGIFSDGTEQTVLFLYM